MKNLDLILPFSIPPEGLEKDLLRAIKAPSLAKLIGSAKQTKLFSLEEFSRALPHEYIMAGKMDSINGPVLSNSPQSTWNSMKEFQLQPQEGNWFTLQPVHIHFASDHLVLMDTRRLQLSEVESKQLFTIAKAMCDEVQMELLYGDVNTWFLRADAWSGLTTATVDAACGHNIDIWMAQGEQARAWRKLQNEIQMAWFSYPINEERENQGLNPVNSVWLSCGSSELLPTNQNYLKNTDATKLIHQENQVGTTLVLDALISPSINNDWAYWLENIHQLEQDYFTPLLSAVKQNRLQQLNLICTDATQAYQFTVTPWSLRQFWIKPSLTKLFSLHSK
ncbi:hypothetical protein [Undibacterium sp. RuRC25W]|uniref:hypothetical protein n=1 Tax=Undibacterium sp. RuRC25W TaxID=3413047 RepID=UPI003BF21EBF